METNTGNRIALFLPDLSGGGAERVMLTLASAFRDRGYRIDLVLAQECGELLIEVPVGVNLVPLATGPVQNRLALGARSIYSLARYLKRTQPGALLSAVSGANFVALAAYRISGYRGRVVVTEVNTHGNFRLPLQATLVRLLYSGADCVVAVSCGVARDLYGLRVPTTRIVVIPNPINTDRVRALAAKNDGVTFCPKKDAPVVATVGRLTEQKDLTTLIDAIALLQNRRRVKLLIIGDGPERRCLESYVAQLGLADQVFFAGFQSNPYAWMVRGDVFALSSRWEGFGLVLAEALALGLPIVSTDCPSGPAEILEHGRYGSLVAPGDAQALAEAINKTIDSPQKADSLMERAEQFNVSAIAERYLRILVSRS